MTSGGGGGGGGDVKCGTDTFDIAILNSTERADEVAYAMGLTSEQTNQIGCKFLWSISKVVFKLMTIV